MKYRVVEDKSLVGKAIADKVIERLGKPVTNIPSESNQDHTSAGDPLRGVLPSMRVWPFPGAVTGNGFGPIIGREPRTSRLGG